MCNKSYCTCQAYEPLLEKYQELVRDHEQYAAACAVSLGTMSHERAAHLKI